MSSGELAVKRIEEGNGDIRMLKMLTEANDSSNKKNSCLLI